MTYRSRCALIALVLLLGPFAALTTVVVATGPGVYFLDADLAATLHRLVLDHPGLGPVLRAVGVLTLPTGLRLIALVVAGLLWRRGHGRAAAWLVGTMMVGGLLGVGLKQVFARSRPEWPDEITVVSGYSFPSGHALNSMLAAACAIVLLRPRLGPAGRRLMWVPAAGFVLVVGFDRLALGVHYLTDVLAGWALALAVVHAGLALSGRITLTDPAGTGTGTRTGKIRRRPLRRGRTRSVRGRTPQDQPAPDPTGTEIPPH